MAFYVPYLTGLSLVETIQSSNFPSQRIQVDLASPWSST